MAEVKWIKIAVDIFDNRKIKQIEKMKNGDSLVVLWFKLLCLAGITNDGGAVYLTKQMPYSVEMLATQTNRSTKIVKEALQVFESFEMIEINEGFISVIGWEEHQNTEKLATIKEQTRNRVKRYRAKKSSVTETQNTLPCNVTVTHDVTVCNATDIDIDIEKDNNISGSSSIYSTAGARTREETAAADEKEMEVFSLWENNIGTISGILRDSLVELLKEVGLSAVKRAIDKAVKRGARNFAYVQATARGIHAGNDFDEKPKQEPHRNSELDKYF